MEVNGIANIKIMLDELTQSSPSLWNHQYDYVEKVHEQLILLERYMLAYAKATEQGIKPPYWHEILANPNLYPLNGNRKP